MTPRSPSGLIEVYLAALALLQSPFITAPTRKSLTELLTLLNDDIRATARVEKTSSDRAHATLHPIAAD